MRRESRTPLRKCLLWHFPISPGRTSDIPHGNHRRRRRRSLQPPNPPSAPHPPPPPVLSFLLRRAARRHGGLRLGRRPPRRRRRRARRRVRSLRVPPEGRHLQPGNGEFLSRSHVRSRNCMRICAKASYVAVCVGILQDKKGEFVKFLVEDQVVGYVHKG